ncbi:hypothetical protein LTS08_001705 [Lithohypha guttulata]|nr:hypothetical protein LTS08_001705 [Lithohypha guttulata]
MPAEILPRQEPCPTPTTITVIQAPPEATMVAADPSSLASFFSHVSAVESAGVLQQSQNRPTDYTTIPETTPFLFSATASAPAALGTDLPNDDSVIYISTGQTSAAVATTVFSFPAWDTPKTNIASEASSTSSASDSDNDGTITITTYVSTETITPLTTVYTPSSNLSITARGLEKRQTCSMVFAPINGVWASWCNNWQGTLVILPTTFETTKLMTTPPGIDPIPQSVYDPSGTLSHGANTAGNTTLEQATSTSIPSSIPKPPSEPTSTSTAASLPAPPAQPSSTSAASIPAVPTSYGNTTSLSSSPSKSSVVVTGTVIVTLPVTTITQTYGDAGSTSSSAGSVSTASPAPAPSSSCGEVADFAVTFDDLPAYSTNNPNDTATPPIFSPYVHFSWSSGYGYGPPPPAPFSPVDGDQLAIYDPTDAGNINTAGLQGRDLPGSFGAGQRAYNSTFWFNPWAVYIGCNNTVSNIPCTLKVTGYQWQATVSPSTSLADGQEVVAVEAVFPAPGICMEPPCALSKISFDASKFFNLSSIRFEAKQGELETGFFLDSVQIVWANRTCEAGLERQGSRK